VKSTKPLLAWNDYLKTGIDIVDQQHRALLDLVNETAARLDSGEILGLDEMRGVLGFLTDYAATHFSTEEALMALSGVSEKHIVHHRQSHTNFLQQIDTMVADLGGDNAPNGIQLMDFLGNWLIYHILGEDQELSQLMQAKPVPGEASQTQVQEAANRSLSRLYAFMADRNQLLQATEKAQRDKTQQMSELVAETSAELVASEERFRALFHNGVLPTVIWRLEQNIIPGLVIDANPAACMLLGYSAEELCRLSPLDLVVSDEVVRFPPLINELQVTGRFEGEIALRTKDGQRLTTQISVTRLVLHGRPVAMAIIQDVSTQRSTQAGKDESRQLDRVRSDFLARLAAPAEAAASALPEVAQVAGQIEVILARQTLFKALKADELAQLVAASQVRHLDKGERLFEKDDEPVGLHVVVHGHIMLAIASPQGEAKVLGIYEAGQKIGEAEVATGSTYPYYAESVEGSVVIEVGREPLLAILDRNRLFARSLINSMGARQHDLVQEVESYTLRSGAQRVIGYLLQHARIHSGGRLIATLPAAKQVIASLLHIKPETLSRIFRDLSAAGLIHVKARQVQIPDIEQLVSYQG
jgi:hemerythrin-like metal-binding protein/PAS domain S-box-containing protein